MNITTRILSSVVLVFTCLAACTSSSAGSGDQPPALDLNPRPDSVVMLTVLFTSTATKGDMIDVVNEVNDLLDTGQFAELPMIDPRYEERKLVIGWRSLEAGKRGEDKVRELLSGSSLVERIDVVR